MVIVDKYQQKLRLEVFVAFVISECDIAAKLGCEPSETDKCHKGYYKRNPGSNEINRNPDVQDKHQKYGV